jgi:hypothetical protein
VHLAVHFDAEGDLHERSVSLLIRHKIKLPMRSRNGRRGVPDWLTSFYPALI